jgi:predicted  nucleic acid-binding Zn-ribbon protein
MLFMMGKMQRHPDAVGGQRHMALDDASDLDGLTDDERVRVVRNEMTRINWRQETLRQELERVEGERAVDERPASGPR